MYNNGLVKTFGILFTLVSIYQLSFTFITNSIENKEDLTFNNLHYVCPLLNSLIASNINVIPIKVKNVLDIKTLNL